MPEKNSLEERMEKRHILYTGKYLNLEKVDVIFPDGRPGQREIVQVYNSVAVLLLDGKNEAHLIRQYRIAIDRTIFEIPAGLLDPGEDAETAALRECEEETGLLPQKLEKLITYAHAEGYSTGYMTLFLGTELKNTGKIKLDSTEFLEPVSIPFPKLEEMVRNNEIIDSKTILSTLLVKNRLKKSMG
jgi:ADP-ribose pyrophosphatase